MPQSRCFDKTPLASPFEMSVIRRFCYDGPRGSGGGGWPGVPGKNRIADSCVCLPIGVGRPYPSSICLLSSMAIRPLGLSYRIIWFVVGLGALKPNFNRVSKNGSKNTKCEYGGDGICFGSEVYNRQPVRPSNSWWAILLVGYVQICYLQVAGLWCQCGRRTSTPFS